ATDADRPRCEADLRAVVTAERAGIDQRLAAAAARLEEQPELAADYSDSLTRITNDWAAVLRAWDARSEGGSTVALQAAARDCIVEIGHLTVPPRVNRKIATLRVGGRMSFYDEFKDELPDRATQLEILEWMSRHPKSVEGVIDLAGGTIVRADPRPRRRVASVVMVLALAGLLLLAASQAVHWQRWLDLPSRSQLGGPEFGRGIVIAYAGAVLHIGIAALKQQRTASATGARTFTALGNVLMWIHVNESALLFYALIVPLTAAAFLVFQGKLVVASLFFVGFAIDSVLDTFVERFEKIVPRQTEIVTTAAKG